MPKSRNRKPPLSGRRFSRSRDEVRTGPSLVKRMAAPLMLTCWLAGLTWVVLYYVIPDTWLFGDLGGWNLVIGMGVIAVGFVFATQWE